MLWYRMRCDWYYAGYGYMIFKLKSAPVETTWCPGGIQLEVFKLKSVTLQTVWLTERSCFKTV